MLNNIKKLFAVLLVLTLLRLLRRQPMPPERTRSLTSVLPMTSMHTIPTQKESWRMDGSLFLQTQAIGMTTIDLMPIKITVLGPICAESG